MIDPQKELDLHGCDILKAELLAEEFIAESKKSKLVKVRLITGKGLHSKRGFSVLQELVWDMPEKQGLEYKYADIWQGDTGALDIKLI